MIARTIAKIDYNRAILLGHSVALYLCQMKALLECVAVFVAVRESGAEEINKIITIILLITIK